MGKSRKNRKLKKIQFVAVIERVEQRIETVKNRIFRNREGIQDKYKGKFFLSDKERQFAGFYILDSLKSRATQVQGGPQSAQLSCFKVKEERSLGKIQMEPLSKVIKMNAL